MLRRVGLPAQALETPDGWVSAERFEKLIEISAEASACEHFGLLVGSAYSTTLPGNLGLLVREQPSVGKAIEIFARHERREDNAVEIRVEHHGSAVVFIPYLQNARARGNRQLVDLFVAAYERMLEAVMGEGWRPKTVCFTHGAPEDTAPFRERLGRVAFGQTVDGIILDAQELAKPVAHGETPTAHEEARRLAQQASRQSSSTTARVEELIDRLLPSGQCTIDRVALHLGVDRRTVHRWLMAEGVSFTELVAAARHRLATELLADGERPLSEVSAQLGFSSLSAFSRWFRHAYGMSASEYRGEGRAVR